MRALEHLPMAVVCPMCNADVHNLQWMGSLVGYYQHCRLYRWSGDDTVRPDDLIPALDAELARRIEQGAVR